MSKLLTSLISVLLFGVGCAAANEEESEPSSESVVFEIEETPEQVKEYWTKERMESAEPMPMPIVNEEGNLIEPVEN